MNKTRREKIKTALGYIQKAMSIVDESLSEENNAFDNLPEALQDSARGDSMQDAINSLECGLESLEEASDEISNIVDADAKYDEYYTKYPYDDITKSLDCTFYIRNLYGNKVSPDIKKITLNTNSKAVFLCITKEKQLTQFGIISEVIYENLGYIGGDEEDENGEIKPLYTTEQSLEEIAAEFISDEGTIKYTTDIFV